MPSIEYRMDVTGIPHTYIVINNGAGVKQMYGFAPAVEGNLWGTGHIYDESVSGQNGDAHLWDYSTGPIEVTAEQYNRVVNEINNAIANPPYYNLPASISYPDAVNQCATWANHLAEVGGFAGKLPWGPNGWNPYSQAAGTQPHFPIFDVSAEIAAGRIDKNTLQPIIDPTTNTATTSALNWVAPRRDPLVLDLDGGGISTSAINPLAPILFDQDGDGIKTASGWIASGEAIVVRDLNGNGLIDSGRELFGDSTILTRGSNAGKLAGNGFEALADLDANADGKFDNTDAAFASVKLWKDVNQDGISQAGELFTFTQLGVASIKVSGTAGNVNLGGGNTQTVSGSFTKVDGTTQLAGSIVQANNNFYRQFTDDPAITATVQALLKCPKTLKPSRKLRGCLAVIHG
jgi:hypothetical protein